MSFRGPIEETSPKRKVLQTYSSSVLVRKLERALLKEKTPSRDRQLPVRSPTLLTSKEKAQIAKLIIPSKSTDLEKPAIKKPASRPLGLLSARESPKRPLLEPKIVKPSEIFHAKPLTYFKPAAVHQKKQPAVAKKESDKQTGFDSRKSDKTASTKKTKLVKSPRSKPDDADKDHLDLKRRLLKISNGNFKDKGVKLPEKPRKISADTSQPSRLKHIAMKKLSIDMNPRVSLALQKRPVGPTGRHLFASNCHPSPLPKPPTSTAVPVVFFENILRLKDVMNRL